MRQVVVRYAAQHVGAHRSAILREDVRHEGTALGEQGGGWRLAVVEQVEHHRAVGEFRVAVLFAGVDHEEVASGEPVGLSGMDVVDLPRCDDHQLRELVVVHGDEGVAGGLTHLADDAGQSAVTEVCGASELFKVLDCRHARNYTKSCASPRVEADRFFDSCRNAEQFRKISPASPENMI